MVVAGGLPPPRTPPIYSASGLVVGDLVAGGLPPVRTPPVYSASGLVVGDLVAGLTPPRTPPVYSASGLVRRSSASPFGRFFLFRKCLLV